MAIEIERRFLVNSNWVPNESDYHAKAITQGYLNTDPERTVRIRAETTNNRFYKCFLTVKGKKSNASGKEFEYEVSLNDAEEMLEMCGTSIIQKIRYTERSWQSGPKWEIDVFKGDNEGLIIAEIELKYLKEKFDIPAWLGKEITDDSRYSNSNLVRNPYSAFKDK